jgi:transcriptional regulator GlxA family with amidase domain
MRCDFDIVIVGSGFAGSLMAMIARRLGHSVVLVERGRHPRFAIGESSTPLATEPLPHSRGALGRFEKMATLIARHFHEPLLIQDIAAAVHLTPDSAMRLFRKFSGITLHECLLQHRVSNAQRLLATTEVKIDDIAAQSGFGSAARFYASFQKVVGQSPAAYRRAIMT